MRFRGISWHALLPDRWTFIELTGAGLLGAGVWMQWGQAFALMLWGGLLLAVAVLQAVQLRAQRREE